MNKIVSFILLGVLLAVSIFIFYKELQASPVWCVTAENYCRGQCWGDFSIDYCWVSPINGGTYCYFWCTGFQHSCDWLDPTYAICFGPSKK